MDIVQFAEKYRARLNDKKLAEKYHLSRSEDTVYGRFGEIVNDESYGAFALKFVAVPRDALMNGVLKKRYRAALAGGLVPKAKHGDESIFHFDPENEGQARLALQLIGAKVRRQIVAPTAAQLAARAALVSRNALRSVNHALEGVVVG